jgi:DNA-binding NarL/FixJ family response regulator
VAVLARHARKRERRITIVFVDPRALTREAFARALEIHGRDLRVMRLAAPGELALATTQGTASLVLLHLAGARLTDDWSVQTIAALRALAPDSPLVLLSEREDADSIIGAISEGIRGFIPLSLELRLVIGALRFVVAGGTFVPAEALVAAFDQPDSHADSRLSPPGPAPLCMPAREITLANFTARQLEVLELLKRALSNKLIARALDMQEATVKVHVRHIMRKLGAANRTQVALQASRLMRESAG